MKKTLFPSKLILYLQLSDMDHAYSKINKNITDNLFSEAGINGYTRYELAQPWQIENPKASFAKCAPSALLQIDTFPSTKELNEEV